MYIASSRGSAPSPPRATMPRNTESWPQLPSVTRGYAPPRRKPPPPAAAESSAGPGARVVAAPVAGRTRAEHGEGVGVHVHQLQREIAPAVGPWEPERGRAICQVDPSARVERVVVGRGDAAAGVIGEI